MNEIFLDLGIVKIYWYSIILLIAFFVGGLLAIKESKKWNITEEFMINLFFFLIPISIIGSRLYFVAFNWSYYQDNLIEIVKTWEGGMAIHGGIIFGLIWIWLYTKKYRVNTFRLFDITVVSLILGQAIGRWGNFINQEAYGAATNIEFLKGLFLPNFIIEGMNINGVYYHPTFLYESIWCIVGFVLLILIRKYKYLKIGQLSSIYLIWYGIGRFFVESLRIDSLMFSDFKMAQVVSIVMIISGIIMYFVFNKGSRFERLYNDKENVENVKF